MDPKSAKIPPQSSEAEASLLGALLIDSEAIVKIADVVTSRDFYDDRHRYIYEAAIHLYEAHSPIDVLTLTERLKNQQLLEVVGGASYITELTNFVPTAAHVEQYGEIIATKAMRRRLIKASQDITNLSYDEARGLKDLIEEAEARLFEPGFSNSTSALTELSGSADGRGSAAGRRFREETMR